MELFRTALKIVLLIAGTTVAQQDLSNEFYQGVKDRPRLLSQTPSAVRKIRPLQPPSGQPASLSFQPASPSFQPLQTNFRQAPPSVLPSQTPFHSAPPSVQPPQAPFLPSPPDFQQPQTSFQQSRPSIQSPQASFQSAPPSFQSPQASFQPSPLSIRPIVATPQRLRTSFNDAKRSFPESSPQPTAQSQSQQFLDQPEDVFQPQQQTFQQPREQSFRQPGRSGTPSKTNTRPAVNQAEEEEEIIRQQALNAKYSFAAGVTDGISDNQHLREEVRDGLLVRGMYSYSDGYFRRTVHYEADENGYRITNEEVEPIGNGPQEDPNGRADVELHLTPGQPLTYSVTAADFKPKTPGALNARRTQAPLRRQFEQQPGEDEEREIQF